MIETVVSLETAKLLKEREFNVNTNAYYDDCNKLQVDKPENDLVLTIEPEEKCAHFSIILDAEFESLKYRVCFNNKLISVCCTKEEAIEYINKVKKNCEGIKLNGAIYEEYIS